MSTIQVVRQMTAHRTVDKVAPIMGDISWQSLARTYFGKSSSWFYHKLHERDVNGTGTPYRFTESELEQLKGALSDLADRIRQVSDSL